MAKRYKCVATDLDKTLLNDAGEISQENKEALLNAMKLGVEVIVASGRSFTSLPDAVFKIPGIKYAVTSNGAAIYSLQTKTCLKRYTIDPESVLRITEIGRKYQVTFEVFIEGQAYADQSYVADPMQFGVQNKEEILTYIKKTRRPVPDIWEFIYSNHAVLDSMDLIIADPDIKEELIKEINETIGNVYVTSSVPHLVEVADQAAGKRAGIEFLHQLLQISPDETICFGDADNDIDMIEYAGLGIAMENAWESVKRSADFVTKSYTDHGVCYGIEKFILEKEERCE